MSTHRRRQESTAAKLVEVCGGLGVVLGILTAVSQQARHHAGVKPCSRAAVRAGTCLGQQLASELEPYIRNGLLGLAIGGLGSVIAVLLLRRAQREWAVGRLRLAIPVLGSVAAANANSDGSTDPRRRRSVPERVRHEVWRRDEGRCVDCDSRERLEFDHIIPISKGGSNTARNIELRCEICNRRKHDHV